LTICASCTTTNLTFSTNTYTPSSTSDSYLLNTDLETQLATANITVQSSGNTGGSSPGNLNVSAPVTWSNTNTLTLSAYDNLNINAPITATGGGSLALVSNNQGGTTTTGTVNFTGGNVQFTGTGSSLTINGNAYTLIQNQSQLQSMTSGLTR